MRIRYGGTCVVLLAVSMVALPLAAQVTVRGGTAPSHAAQRRELEQARKALEDASQSLEDALERLGRAGVDTAARTAAREALAEAGRAVDRAQSAYMLQQRRALEADARRAMRAQVARAQRTARVAPRAATAQRASQQGWLGIFFSDSMVPGQGGSVGFPRIVSVEPGSPADRAGLEAGDQLVAIDGHSLRGRDRNGRATSITEMLHPGARIPVRILRGDESKELHVRVGRRPGAFSFRIEGGGSGGVTPEAIVTTIPPMPPVEPAPAARPSRPSAPASASAVTPVPAHAFIPSGAFPSESFGTFYFNGVSTIAGAQLWRVDDLKDYFHVNAGLLVLRVLPGTPTDRAGLRSGDVIVRADGRTVTSLRTLQRALELAEDQSNGHAVPLDVVRKGTTIHATLRW